MTNTSLFVRRRWYSKSRPPLQCHFAKMFTNMLVRKLKSLWRCLKSTCRKYRMRTIHRTRATDTSAKQNNAKNCNKLSLHNPSLVEHSRSISTLMCQIAASDHTMLNSNVCESCLISLKHKVQEQHRRTFLFLFQGAFHNQFVPFMRVKNMDAQCDLFRVR